MMRDHVRIVTSDPVAMGCVMALVVTWVAIAAFVAVGF